ncbi:MAG: hypothetical protein J6V80_02365 [Clostridia bacterium]|nr:hypothetical protein [Clostridia bacterium]
MIYTISNSKTKVNINSLGAEVRSVVHCGKERTWQNESGEWAGCAILLFPFAGFNHLFFDGVDFGVQKHGFCRNEEFNLVMQGEDFIEFELTHNERTKAVYPFDFSFKVRYTLTDDGYSVSYTVRNLGDKSMPLACGGHESFALDKEVPGYFVEFEKAERFDFLIANRSGRLTGEITEHGEGTVLPLEEEFTSNSSTVILADINSRRVALRDKETKEKIVEISFEGFDNLLLWHPHGTKMLCIEPWQCLPSYVDEKKEFSERKGVINLSQGSEVTFTRMISY